jgi:lysophospholipase L1-like esterase
MRFFQRIMSRTAKIPTVEKGALKIACIGDSLTYGYLVENRSENCYPSRLGQMLGENFVVGNFGVNGHTMQKSGDLPYWSHKNFELSTEFNPHIIFLMLGSNDSKPQNWTTLENYLADYESMIEYYQNLPNRPRLYLMTPPMIYTGQHFSFTSIRLNPILEMAPAIKTLGKSRGLPVIDIHEATIERPECFQIDGVHTNAEGALLIAKEVFNTLYPK